MNFEEKLQTNIILAPYTTYNIGGPAEFFIEVKTRDDLSEAIRWAKTNGHKFFILGGGSNILVTDDMVKGLVIHMVNDSMVARGERIETESGTTLGRVMRLSVANNLTGLEWANGIPGTIGGAIRGNAGAYSYSMGDSVETVEIFSVKNEKFYKLSKNDCEFGYRDSLFKKNDDLIIWQSTIKLQNSSGDEIKKRAEEYLSDRIKKQPKLPSAGSVFINFTIEELGEASPELARKAKESGKEKGGKVAAGWVIDQLDLRGKSMGGAKVSLEHANFIVNTSRATAAEVAMLISYIKQQVRTKYGVQLREEIQYIGF